MKSEGVLLSVQALRGLAATLVLLLHATAIWPVKPLIYLPIVDNMGWIGVRLFFVISGFIIADRIGLAGGLRHFLLRRYLRVLPLNVFATLTALTLAWATAGGPMFSVPRTDSGAEYAPGAFYLLKSLLIWPQDNWPYLFVGWSLKFEVMFYATFGLLVFGLGQRAATVAFVALAMWVWSQMGFGWDYTLTFYLYFAFGILAREWIALNPGPIVAGLLAAMGLGVVLAASEGGVEFGNWFIFLTGAGFMGLLVFGVVLERRGWIFTQPNMLTWLGDISFSLYLVHALVVNFGGFLMRGVPLSPGGAEVARLVVVVAAVVCAGLTWRWIERPINYLVKTRLVRRPEPIGQVAT